jgi:hypothetical protein
MDAQQIRKLQPMLNKYLSEFDDCFGRSEPAGTPLEVMPHVAFQRYHIERCFEGEKGELGIRARAWGSYAAAIFRGCHWPPSFYNSPRN